MSLLDLLKTPSSFKNDYQGFLVNQTLHGYLVGGGLVLLGVSVPIVLAAYAAWEMTQIFVYKGEPWDSLEDMGHVSLVAMAFSTGMYELLFIHLLWLMAGTLERYSRRG